MKLENIPENLAECKRLYEVGNFSESLRRLNELRPHLDEAHPLYAEALTLTAALLLSTSEKKGLLDRADLEKLLGA